MIAARPPTPGRTPFRPLRHALALLLLASAVALANPPADWVVFEHLGVAIALPPGNSLLDEADGSLIAGDVAWKQFLLERSVDRPAGMLLEISPRYGSDLRYYRDDPSLTRLADATVGGVPFEVYLGRDSIPLDSGAVPIIGRLLIGRNPLAGGRYLVIGLTHAGLAEGEALAAIDAVLANLEARDAALLRDEIPLTHGLDGMLQLRIPRGWTRNWDRDNFFRIQSDEFPLSFLQVKVGAAPNGGDGTAVEDLARALEWLTEGHRIERQTFFGEPVIAIEFEEPGYSERLLVFERCLPGDALVLLRLALHDPWRGADGFPFEAFLLTLPEGSAACSEGLLAALRGHLE